MKGMIPVALCLICGGAESYGCPTTEEYAIVHRMLEREGRRLLSPSRVEAEWRKVFDSHASVAGIVLSSTRFSDWEFHYDGGSYRLVYVYDQKSGDYAFQGDAMITLTFKIQTEFVPETVRLGSRTEVVKREVVSSVALAGVEARSGVSELE